MNILLWIWGIIVGLTVLGGLVSASVNIHKKGHNPIENENDWGLGLLLACLLPLLLCIVLPVVIILWICHLIVGLIIEIGKFKHD